MVQKDASCSLQLVCDFASAIQLSCFKAKVERFFFVHLSDGRASQTHAPPCRENLGAGSAALRGLLYLDDFSEGLGRLKAKVDGREDLCNATRSKLKKSFNFHQPFRSREKTAACSRRKSFNFAPKQAMLEKKTAAEKSLNFKQPLRCERKNSCIFEAENRSISL